MNLPIAPVVLFVYNRPLHTLQTLDALCNNDLADESILYIYSDGPKANATGDQLKNIDKVRRVIRSKNWCKEVHIIEATKNKGLANSIIEGVTEIVNQYGKVIVLEDDLVTSKGFLSYMNDALQCYSDVDKVGCIHGWNYELKSGGYGESTFFLRGGDCWGWATWKRAWSVFNPDGAFLLKSILAKNIQYEFDRRGTHGYQKMLSDQVDGNNDSWAIRWHASLFLADKYCLQPTHSIVKNIGLDNSGIHCVDSDLVQNPIEFISVKKIEVRESEWFYKAYASSIQEVNNNSGSNKWQKLKTSLKRLYHQ